MPQIYSPTIDETSPRYRVRKGKQKGGGLNQDKRNRIFFKKDNKVEEGDENTRGKGREEGRPADLSNHQCPQPYTGRNISVLQDLWN